MPACNDGMYFVVDEDGHWLSPNTALFKAVHPVDPSKRGISQDKNLRQ